MYTFVVILLLWVWTMRIVLSNLEKPMIYEFAVMRWGRRERHFADGHAKDDVSGTKEKFFRMTPWLMAES